jgi:hypothetical protein
MTGSVEGVVTDMKVRMQLYKPGKASLQMTNSILDLPDCFGTGA